MTFDQFSPVFATLAMQLRAHDADEAMARSYLIALKDLESEFIAMAATRMAQRGGSLTEDNPHWFPKTSEWRQLAITIERERTEELRKRLRALPAPLCLQCDDTGWDRRTDDDRVLRCDCQRLRRLEILGRRPMPERPALAGGAA